MEKFIWLTKLQHVLSLISINTAICRSTEPTKLSTGNSILMNIRTLLLKTILQNHLPIILTIQLMQKKIKSIHT